MVLLEFLPWYVRYTTLIGAWHNDVWTLIQVSCGHCLVRPILVAGVASVLPQLAVFEQVRLKILSHNLLRALVCAGYQCTWAVRGGGGGGGGGVKGGFRD